MVPGSTLMQGSSLIIVTLMPRASRIAPREAAAMPLPSEDTTPPVINTYRVMGFTEHPAGDTIACLTLPKSHGAHNSTRHARHQHTGVPRQDYFWCARRQAQAILPHA